MTQELDFTCYPDCSNLVYSEDNLGHETILYDFFEILRFDPPMAMMGSVLSNIVRSATKLEVDRFAVQIYSIAMNAENEGKKNDTYTAMQLTFPNKDDQESQNAVRGLVERFQEIKDSQHGAGLNVDINLDTFVIHGSTPRDLFEFLQTVAKPTQAWVVSLDQLTILDAENKIINWREKGKESLKNDWVLSSLPQRLHTTMESLYADAFRAEMGGTSFSHQQIEEALDIQERIDAHVKDATARYAAPTFNPYWH